MEFGGGGGVIGGSSLTFVSLGVVVSILLMGACNFKSADDVHSLLVMFKKGLDNG